MKTLVLVFLGSVLAFPACSTDSPKSEVAPTPKTPPASTPAPAQPAATTPPPAPAPATPAPAAPAPAAPAPAAGGADMAASIKTLMATPEHTDAAVEVQHVLIAFQGSGVPKATRTKAEAEVLAQQVYAEAVGGADFGALVKKYTDDSAPGIYPMTKAGRTRMVRAFGDVGWRLKVGEIGVAPFDSGASPYGWHIIKRLK